MFHVWMVQWQNVQSAAQASGLKSRQVHISSIKSVLRKWDDISMCAATVLVEGLFYWWYIGVGFKYLGKMWLKEVIQK